MLSAVENYTAFQNIMLLSPDKDGAPDHWLLNVHRVKTTHNELCFVQFT